MTSFWFQAFVFLTAAVVAVPIAKRLGLGSVLGYLIAGVAIGPHVLELVGEERSDIMHFAEFGVVMMLFLIGLELRPSMLWRMRGPILGLGGAQVLATAFLVALGAYLLGSEIREGVAIGLILALSSTAIVLQTLSEKGLLQSDDGRASFAVLLFQDIAVIPILAFLPLLAVSRGSGGQDDSHASGAAAWVDALPGGLRAIVVLAGITAVVALGKFFVRPAFRAIASAKLREIFTAAALLLVIGIAMLMQAVGLSPALGTFLAGVVLADNEFRHELEADIEPFKGLLLGLFFLAVGASIDFGMLASEPLVLGGLVVGYLAIKFTVLFTLARIFDLQRSQRLRFGFLLSQGGEFAFVLVSFALQSDVLGDALASRLIAVVALSMLTTPLLLLLDERFVQPRFAAQSENDDREADTPDEEHPVVIAGNGRFGVTVLRLLKANGFGAVVLDQDPAQIAMLERFDHKSFYGDASRIDLLRAAGLDHAAAFVLAVDDPDAAQHIAELVRKHFPDVPIFARAHSMQRAYELMRVGCQVVERETFGSALELGGDVLRQLGFRAYQAMRAVRTFRHHEKESMRELLAHAPQAQDYVRIARRRAAELTRLIERDRERNEQPSSQPWDVDPMRRLAKGDEDAVADM